MLEVDLKRSYLVITAFWIIAFLVALAVDSPVAIWVHSSGVGPYVQHARIWPEVLKVPGVFWTNLAVAFFLVILRQVYWKQGIFVVLAGALSGLNSPIKWLVGRYRPFKSPGQIQPNPFHFEPLWHGVQGFFKQGPLSFPSGHESTAFALAVALVIVWPRGGWLFVIFAFITGLERISENAHYASDVVGAVGFAMLCVWLLHLLLGEWIKPSAVGPQPNEDINHR